MKHLKQSTFGLFFGALGVALQLIDFHSNILATFCFAFAGYLLFFNWIGHLPPKFREWLPENLAPKVRIFAKRSDLDSDVIKRLLQSRHADLCAVSLSFLKPHLNDLQDLVEKGKLSLHIWMANVDSNQLQQRFKDEGGSHSPESNKRRIAWWLDHAFPNQVKLFDHYPTYAVYIFDKEEVWFYLYGFRKFGYSCPTVTCTSDTEVVAFFRQQFQDIYDNGSQFANQVYNNKDGFGPPETRSNCPPNA